MKKDKIIVNAFVAYLRENGFPDLKIDRYPDEENSEHPDIDAIAGDFAIEHTSIDTLTNQRQYIAWFKKALGGLDKKLTKEMSIQFRLVIIISYDVIDANKSEQNWGDIRNALKNWITQEANDLPYGRSVFDNTLGKPFSFSAMKKSSSRPGIFIGLSASNDDTLSDRIQELLGEKAEKFEKYSDKTKVLLVESYDLALMNVDILRENIKKAFPHGIPMVDEIWYADTSFPDKLEFQQIFL